MDKKFSLEERVLILEDKEKRLSRLERNVQESTKGWINNEV